jgi:hypothetical protein
MIQVNPVDSGLSNGTQYQPGDSERVKQGNGNVPALGHEDRQNLWPCLNMILNTRSVTVVTPPGERTRLTPWRRTPPLLFVRHDDDGGGWDPGAAERQRVFHRLHDQCLSCLVINAH